jgi:hypothetical protein
MDEKTPSLAMRLQSAGVKKSHAYMIAWGKRAPSLPLAIRIHAAIGEKLGPVANMTDAQIKALARSMAEAA